MKRFLLLALLSVCLLSGCAENITDSIPDNTPAFTEEAKPEELPFSYKLTDGEAAVYSYTGGDTACVIPSYIEGAPVTKIHSSFFSDETLRSVTLPQTLTQIQRSSSSSITEIIIPAEIERLEPTWFEGLSGLTQFTVTGEGNYCSQNGVVYSADMKTLVLAPNTLSGEFSVPDGVESIGDRALRSSSITGITLPSSVRRIGNQALCCESLERVSFSEGLEEIGEFAFSNTAITEAQLPRSLKVIGDNAFLYSALEKVTLNEGLESLGASAFSFTQISELYIPETLTECGFCPVGTDTDILISLPSFSGVFSEFKNMPNAFLRNGTALENALHRAAFIPDATTKLFTDLSGDGFPELLCWRENALYVYDIENGCWNRFSTGEIQLCEEDESGERFLLITKYAMLGWEQQRFDSSENGIIPTNIIYCSCYAENYWDEEPEIIFADVPPYHIIKEYTHDSIIEEYGLNGISQVYCERFCAEPFGEPVEAPEINGERVSEFPFVLSEVPEKMKIFIGGQDILHDAPPPEGVTFNYLSSTLTLDNAKLYSEEGNCISVNFGGIDNKYSTLNIEIIGDCEVLSGTAEAFLSNVDLNFMGSGSLSTSGIVTTNNDIDLTFRDSVTITETAGGKSGIRNAGSIKLYDSAQVTAFGIDRDIFAASTDLFMKNNSRLTLGSEEQPISDICCIYQLNLHNNSQLEIFSSSYALYSFDLAISLYQESCLLTHSKYGIYANTVTLFDSAVLSTELLSIKCALLYGGTLECSEKLELDEVVSPYADPKRHRGQLAVFGRAAFTGGGTEWFVDEVDTENGTDATPEKKLRRNLTVTVTPKQ